MSDSDTAVTEFVWRTARAEPFKFCSPCRRVYAAVWFDGVNFRAWVNGPKSRAVHWSGSEDEATRWCEERLMALTDKEPAS